MLTVRRGLIWPRRVSPARGVEPDERDRPGQNGVRAHISQGNSA